MAHDAAPRSQMVQSGVGGGAVEQGCRAPHLGEVGDRHRSGSRPPSRRLFALPLVELPLFGLTPSDLILFDRRLPEPRQRQCPRHGDHEPQHRQPGQPLPRTVPEPHHAHQCRPDRLPDHHRRGGRGHRAALQRRRQRQKRRPAPQQQRIRRRIHHQLR
ncbi:hypothetical protein ADK35_02570, partial [Streptomyces viridochromogenes]